MQAPLHSPEPWHVHETQSYPIVIMDANRNYVASVHKVPGPEEQVKANARLIVAAPENHREHMCLLVHVQRLLKIDWTNQDNCHYLNDVISLLREQAKDSAAAIAKGE